VNFHTLVGMKDHLGLEREDPLLRAPELLPLYHRMTNIGAQQDLDLRELLKVHHRHV